jgi:tRNA G18 (ribose-2'-O)-methylase SpoU
LAEKIDKQINKTALGAEAYIAWEHAEDLTPVLEQLRKDGFTIVAVEQSVRAIQLPEFRASDKVALLVGREVEGVELDVLEKMDQILEIPMFGEKESFNVVQAAAMALYHCRFQ